MPPSHPPVPAPKTPSLPEITTTASSKECSSDRISQSPSPTTPPSGYTSSRSLSHDRVVSSIPRAFPSTAANSSIPSNAESETGASKSGNWIYPSESQFFHAVMRKDTLSSSSPEDLASSISSIIPIHNAVNERAWHLIKQWEAPTTASTQNKTCVGPKLLSFQGLGAGAKSPKARIMTVLGGYTEPFDRHDWVVERCNGQQVEYVIDFYQGKASTDDKKASNLNFYLDVRPKLNSLEGWRMRAERMAGWR
jgi:cytochrome c heme-lyase